VTAVRARDLGLRFDGEPGHLNAITDVPGVEVGMRSLVSGDGPLVTGRGPVRTGVTTLLPLGKDRVARSVPAGWYALNGNGEMTGTAWLDETGALSLPIGLTNTHAVGAVHRGIIEWAVSRDAALADRWLLPVVAETWDGYLNDINGNHVTAEVTKAALDGADCGPVTEGSVGGGTGMTCYGFKGGTGTSSRRVVVRGRDYTVAVLTQANFGRRHELVIAGRRIGPLLAEEDPSGDWQSGSGAGSCITIVGTDAPLLPGQCRALARRVPLGLARTGTTGSHFSGDLFLAFSARNIGALDSSAGATGHPTQPELRSLEFVPWGDMDPFYEAVVQSVEESVVNVLAASTTMVGRDGHRSPGFPSGRLPELMAQADRR
jgi:L-aminopeptidase/D-esterase-like protein